MADKCVACVRASKDPKTHTDDLHHAELLRVNGRCAQLGFDLESAQSLNEDLKARLLAAERERDEYKLAATSKIEALVLAISRRDALAETFGPLMNEADWHVEGCDCAGCKWFERARAALRALKADNPRGGA
jgi:hypothetical protein